MKRGITAEFDYKDDGITISKKKGRLTFEEIREALREREGGGRFLIMIDLDCEWDDQGDYIGLPEGDSVKAYSLTSIETMYRK